VTDKIKADLAELVNDLERTDFTSSAPASEMARAEMSPDEPIQNSSEDLLNRTGFATELARAIIRFDRTDSVVVAIHGRWGTGKTSLLNLVEEELGRESVNAPIIFRFNPWGFSDQTQLGTRFFNDLSTFLRLHKTIRPLYGISDAVEEYGTVLSPMAHLIFPRATEALKVGWRWFRKLRPAQGKTAPELKNLINEGLREANSKLIIMIDDIDRLNVEEIRSVFQLVKINANFANTVYLLSFDRRPVERALQKISPGPAKEYLEKIVQVPFSLPPIADATLTQIMGARFDELLLRLNIKTLDRQRFGNMFYAGFRKSFHTIRDVNRYFNVFGFAANLMYQDTDFVDLAAIQALSVFYPSVYKAIEGDPDLFRGGLQQQANRDEYKQKYDKIFESISTNKRVPAREMVAFLFPKVEWVYGPSNTIYSSDWEKQWRKSKRICSTKYFPYYFQLAVPLTEVSQSEFDGAIETATSVVDFCKTLENFEDSNRFTAFVELLRNQLASLDRQKLLVVLDSIFVFGDRLEYDTPVLFGVISDFMQFGVWLLRDILDTLPERERFQILAAAMARGSALFTISDVAAMFAKDTESTEPYLSKRFPDLNRNVTNNMKSIAVDKFREGASSGDLAVTRQLGPILYRWREWGNAREATDWVASFLTSPERAIALVVGFAGNRTSAGLHDRVAKTTVTVQTKLLSEFVNLDRIAGFLNQIDDKTLTEFQRQAKTRFLSDKATLDAGKDPSNEFPFDDE
jgi:predicted KAP-like P-loop ATPase